MEHKYVFSVLFIANAVTRVLLIMAECKARQRISETEAFGSELEDMSVFLRHGTTDEPGRLLRLSYTNHKISFL